jgi:hypothetical protein
MLLAYLPHLPLMLLHHPLLTHYVLILQPLHRLLVFRVVLHQRLLQLILILLGSLVKLLVDDLFMVRD